MITVKNFEGMGRGIQTDSRIHQYELIAKYEVLVLSDLDTICVNNCTDLKHYTFKYDNTGRDCLVLGHGEIFNHSDDANVEYRLEDYEGRKVMAFYAKRDISPGEQLFIDYSADTDVDVKSYLAAPSLTGGG